MQLALYILHYITMVFCNLHYIYYNFKYWIKKILSSRTALDTESCPQQQLECCMYTSRGCNISLIMHRDISWFVLFLHFFSFAALIVFIGRIVPENSLFCSHSDLLHTMTDSATPFCVISGKQTQLYWCRRGSLLHCRYQASWSWAEHVAESITTDAGRFGHVGLCQLRTKLKILQ